MSIKSSIKDKESDVYLFSPLVRCKWIESTFSVNKKNSKLIRQVETSQFFKGLKQGHVHRAIHDFNIFKLKFGYMTREGVACNTIPPATITTGIMNPRRQKVRSGSVTVICLVINKCLDTKQSCPLFREAAFALNDLNAQKQEDEQRLHLVLQKHGRLINCLIYIYIERKKLVCSSQSQGVSLIYQCINSRVYLLLLIAHIFRPRWSKLDSTQLPLQGHLSLTPFNTPRLFLSQRQSRFYQRLGIATSFTLCSPRTT